MLKRYLLYALLILLVAVAGMYGYTKWTEAKEKVNLWTLVPDDAVLVVESTDHEKILSNLRSSEYWDNIAAVELVESLTENINLLDTLSNRREGASRFLKRKQILTSLHVVSKTDFNFVFYIPVNTVGEHRFIRNLIDNINKNDDFSQTSYDYQQFLITDFRNINHNDTISYFSFHNNLIVSSNKELLKEIIRKINRGQLTSPAEAYDNINYLGQPDVFAHLFINYRYLPGFLNLFLNQDLQNDITYLASLCQNSMLGLKYQRNSILLNGFSNPEPLSESFYSQIKDQTPQPFNLKTFLPAQTALALTFGLNRPGTVKQLRAEDKKLKWPAREIILADSLVKTFRGEMAIGYLPAEKNEGAAEKVILVQSGNQAGSAGILQALINQANLTAGRKNKPEPFAGFNIHRIPLPQLPLLLFGSIAGGFEECFVTRVENCFIFGQNAAAVRRVLADIRDGKVWANNERHKIFLEHTQQEANFSLYVQTDLLWPLLRAQIPSEQQSSLLRHETLIKNLGQLAFQFSRQENQYYTSLVMRQPIADTTLKEEETFKTQFSTNFRSSLISAPFYLGLGRGTAPRVVVQDSSLTLHALAANGQISWSDSLREGVVGPGYPVVSGPDNKINYLFATANQIHLLDQNGSNVKNFPFNLPDSVQINGLKFLPAESPANNRLLVWDKAGNIFIFDFNGNIQEGWEPKITNSPLALAPQHVIQGNREVILTLHQNGYIYAFNRRGERYPGFPVAVSGTYAGDVFIKKGDNLRTTQATTVTAEGQLITINLTGQVMQRKQLPKANNRATWALVSDPENDSYVISRQEPGRVYLFDQNQKLLLRKNLITSSPKLVQYFDFGPLNRIYILTETGPGKSYLYNYKARQIGEEPIVNNLPVALDYNKVSNSYNLYLSRPQELQKLIFRDK